MTLDCMQPSLGVWFGFMSGMERSPSFTLANPFLQKGFTLHSRLDGLDTLLGFFPHIEQELACIQFSKNRHIWLMFLL